MLLYIKSSSLKAHHRQSLPPHPLQPLPPPQQFSLTSQQAKGEDRTTWPHWFKDTSLHFLTALSRIVGLGATKEYLISLLVVSWQGQWLTQPMGGTRLSLQGGSQERSTLDWSSVAHPPLPSASAWCCISHCQTVHSLTIHQTCQCITCRLKCEYYFKKFGPLYVNNSCAISLLDLLEDAQVISFLKILHHEIQIGMVYHTELECDKLAEVAGSYIVFIGTYFLRIVWKGVSCKVRLWVSWLQV